MSKQLIVGKSWKVLERCLVCLVDLIKTLDFPTAVFRHQMRVAREFLCDASAHERGILREGSLGAYPPEGTALDTRTRTISLATGVLP